MRASTTWAAFALCVVTAHGPTGPATAQSWPERSVRIIIPLPAGSPSDVALRRLAEKLSERWAQPVVVENKQGADGILAVTAVLGARDNHTLLFSFPGVISINPYLHEKLPYDPKELLPIAPVLDNFIGFAASSALGVNTLAELVAAAQANPGKISWSALPAFRTTSFSRCRSAMALTPCASRIEISRQPIRTSTKAACRYWSPESPISWHSDKPAPRRSSRS